MIGDSAEQVIAVEQSAARLSITFGAFLKKFTYIFNRTRFTRYEKLSFHKMNTKDHLHGENWLKDKRNISLVFIQVFALAYGASLFVSTRLLLVQFARVFARIVPGNLTRTFKQNTHNSVSVFSSTILWPF